MKLTTVYYRGHNMYRWIRRHWFAQSKKQLFNTPMREILHRNNIRVYEAAEVMQEPPVKWTKKIATVGVGTSHLPKVMRQKNEPCLFHRDRNVLLEGLNQAKLLTNTTEIEKGLPQSVMQACRDADISDFEESIQMALASAVVYDATQEKLPKRRNLENPAWKYPRDYGIIDSRRNFILCNRFLHLCEMKTAGTALPQHRCKLSNAFFSVPLVDEQNSIRVQLQMESDILLLADEPIKPLAPVDFDVSSTGGLPNLEPLSFTVSLEEEYSYELKNTYPIKSGGDSGNLTNACKHAHTALVHFNETQVKNLHGTPVSQDQIMARSLMKSFTIAAAEARFLYGENVGELPEPVVVQCVQTDAKYFHFSIFQLNTLSWPWTCTKQRNVFWHDSLVSAYEFGGYYNARPTISSYNGDVFKMLLTFYQNK